MNISFLFSFTFGFSTFLSNLYSLLEQPFCQFAFLFWGDSFDQCVLYNLMNLCPQLFRHSIYQIKSLKSICHFNCVIIRDLILVRPEWSSGFPYFLQFKSEFCNEKFKIWATVSSQSCFCWLYRAPPSLDAKNIINLILLLTIWWCPSIESSLVLLEEGVCSDQCILLAKLCYLCLVIFVLQGQTCPLL